MIVCELITLTFVSLVFELYPSYPIGMFNGAANGSSHHHNANGSKANNTKANTTGETFQIKPMKQRTNKKHSLCILL